MVKEKAYPDHHAYTTEDARELVNIARERGATLVTTEKDAMRFKGHSGSLRDLDNASTKIPAKLTFEDPDYLRSLLRQAIRQWRRDMVLVEFD